MLCLHDVDFPKVNLSVFKINSHLFTWGAGTQCVVHYIIAHFAPLTLTLTQSLKFGVRGHDPKAFIMKAGRRRGFMASSKRA